MPKDLQETPEDTLQTPQETLWGDPLKGDPHTPQETLGETPEETPRSHKRPCGRPLRRPRNSEVPETFVELVAHSKPVSRLNLRWAKSRDNYCSAF